MSHKVLIALVALVVLGLLLAVGVWAYDDAQKDQIASGIEVGGVDIGGRDADSARKIIKRQVVAPLQQPVVVSYQGKDYTLSPKQLHETADVDGMVQEAIDRSRQGNILDRVTRYASGGDVNADLAPRVSYDKGAVKDFVNHIDYVVKLIGIDHVGISSDFDGGGGVDGWNGADETFKVTLELVRRGYTEEQIAKIWSGNLLRVWGEVEKVAARIQAGSK